MTLPKAWAIAEFSMGCSNDDDARLMKIQSHDTNLEGGGVEIEWRTISLSTSD